MDGAGMLKIGFTEFIDGIVGSTNKRIPFDGAIEITSKCNLNCIHCYLKSPQNAQKEKLNNELTYEEICKIIDEIVSEGCIRLLITGGEPLLREDFLDIYAYAKKQGLLVGLFTNGTLISSQIADYLKEFPPSFLEISLYGATKETYEKITEIPGSFYRCIQGINLLKERKIPFKLKTVLIKKNQDELLKMKRWAKRVSGKELTYSPFIIPRVNGNTEPCTLRIPPELVVKFDNEGEERVEYWQKLLRNVEKPILSNKLHFCEAGLKFFFIDSYGRLSLCLQARTPHYDLRKGSFQKGWYDFLPRARKEILVYDESHICYECDWQLICGSCPVKSKQENNDSKQPVDYDCKIMKLRVKQFKQEGY